MPLRYRPPSRRPATPQFRLDGLYVKSQTHSRQNRTGLELEIRMNRREFIVAGVAAAGLPGVVHAQSLAPRIEVYKSPTCGCCSAWVEPIAEVSILCCVCSWREKCCTGKTSCAVAQRENRSFVRTNASSRGRIQGVPHKRPLRLPENWNIGRVCRSA